MWALKRVRFATCHATALAPHGSCSPFPFHGKGAGGLGTPTQNQYSSTSAEGQHTGAAHHLDIVALGRAVVVRAM